MVRMHSPECPYSKRPYSKRPYSKRPYFDTRARYGREADTIIFWYGITPTGKESKYYATLRFNSERNISDERKQEKIDNYQFPKLPKGYTWSDPIQYS